MTTESTNAAITQLNKATNCLIVLPPNANGDSIAAGLALRSFLRKMEKETVIVTAGLLDKRYSFLEGFEKISGELKVTKNFVIYVSTKRTPLDELSYKKDPDQLAIYLKPKGGELKESDVTFNTADFPFDTIITIGVKSFDGLGEMYSNNADLFFQVPVINIDYRSGNESFGQLNLIQLNSTSVSEVVMDLIFSYEASLMDESIATALLAGIITETNSFQHTRTAPSTFLKASQLISSGAKQQEIVSALYRSKSLTFLKLWGRALARISQDTKTGLVHTLITNSDFQKSGATEAEIEQIIPEMAIQLKLGKVFMVLRELATGTEIVVQTPTTIDPAMILGGYQPTVVAPNTVKFTLNLPLIEAESKVSTLIRQELERLNA